MLHKSKFSYRTALLKYRIFQSLPRWMCKDWWQVNRVSWDCKRLVKFMYQWRFLCMGLKWLLPQCKCKCRCTRMNYDQQQPNGLTLLHRRKYSDWISKSDRCHVINTSILINYSNIARKNYCRKQGLWQPLTPAYSQGICSNDDYYTTLS